VTRPTPKTQGAQRENHKSESGKQDGRKAVTARNARRSSASGLSLIVRRAKVKGAQLDVPSVRLYGFPGSGLLATIANLIVSLDVESDPNAGAVDPTGRRAMHIAMFGDVVRIGTLRSGLDMG
jgi:hypothetical protein